ncbi:MAG: IS200/IS605 family transposase [Lachnoclostridium sp.]|nr:IS200/IS605 family transposase [Lachnoclostridium sp.]
MIYYEYERNLIHSRTCVYNINYHVVWSVKYRRKILSAEIERYLKELVHQIAADKGFTVHLFEVGEGDHIHCFVSGSPKLSITDIVKYLKGITGRKLFKGGEWNAVSKRYNGPTESGLCKYRWAYVLCSI